MFLQRSLKSFLKRARVPAKGTAPHQTLLSTTIREESLDRYTAGGYHPVRIGDLFKDGAYKVINKLGYGQYSTVWLAYDTRNNRHVAMKILTADAFDTIHSSLELDILHKISRYTKSLGSEHILHLLDEFSHEGPNGVHICLVFKAMGPDLSRYRKLFPDVKIPVPIAKSITKQVLLALAFLHETNHVIHCDIKPQNILVETAEINEMFNNAPSGVFAPDSIQESPDDFYVESVQLTSGEEDITTSTSLNVRIADFGTSSWYDKHLTEWIQPQLLRAPEVILGAPWDWRVDIWNLGTLLWELVEGKVLFDGTATPKLPYTAEAHLAQMTAILGKMPEQMLNRGQYAFRYFDHDANLLVPSPFSHLTLESVSSYQASDKKAYLEFISSMTQLLPESRPSALALLKSPWLCV
ncbi:serine kinase [Ampelomyces quisqualis]|uniref:non-specific serine/threonine protein kinase n=1 Tax=Ampelomyces quisqualis TaxID=50730 RepID=A0A6A5QZK0_AMPQU|nr:serine kinase [Ampelomyces quisqualis]